MERNSEGDFEPLNQSASESISLRENSRTPRSSASPNIAASSMARTTSAMPSVPCPEPTPAKEEEYFAAILPPDPKIEDEGHGCFHWVIDDWTQLPERMTSETFTVAGHDWGILLFPRGNQVSDTVSLYIEYKPKESDGSEWHACATFSLAMSNVEEPDIYTHKTTHHRFTPEESDWGFTNFPERQHLMMPSMENGGPALIDKGRVRISAYVRVHKDPFGVLWHNFHNYNSRLVTGFVGLRNQGATCYMNSLLQSLFFTNQFRDSVYQIPTENDDPKKSVALALQRVFYSLENSKDPVDTTELTKSFGWDSLESFMQHDVQEFNRVLQDSLETKMKGTVVDGAIAKLFEGKMKSYIRCVNVDYESSRVENYYDISLNVKGCKTLHDSFANYCEVEMLDGENKYQAEGHGLQDARKGVIFESFPPVLQLQLKRFEYDFMRDAMVKINDRHEFPPSIDLSEFLSDDADRSKSWKYNLHGVLVHSGDLHGGHYFALLRPTTEDRWFKFDDDRVVPVSRDEVFGEYFGGEFLQPGMQQKQLQQQHNQQQQQQQPNYAPPVVRNRPMSKRFTNAYMLVYIREALSDEVLGSGNVSAPEHLLKRIQHEKEERERREREQKELLNFLPVKVVSDREFAKHQGFDLCHFGQRQSAENQLFNERVPRKMILGEFKALYAQRTGRDPEKIRFWTMVSRVNKTIRCDSPLLADSMHLPIDHIKETRSPKWNDLRLYCEDWDPLIPHGRFLTEAPAAEESMIHTKFFDPQTQTMTGMKNMYVRAGDAVESIVPRLYEMANLPHSAAITLYEEVKPSLIEKMDVKLTFHQAEIQSGDIICFQVADSQGANGHINTVAEYFSDVQYRVSVRFVPRPPRSDSEPYASNNSVSGSDPELDADGKSKAHVFTGSKHTPYDRVAHWLAQQIGVNDPLKLRFFTVGPTGQPRQPVRRTQATTMSEMLPNTAYYTNAMLNSEGLHEFTVMYEILEVNIVEMESMRSIRVTFVGKSMREETQIDVLVSKLGMAQSLFEATYCKVEQILRGSQQRSSQQTSVSANDEAHLLSSPKPFRLRFYISAYHRFSKELNGTEPIADLGHVSINEVVAELLLPDARERSVDDDSRMDTDGSDSLNGSGNGADIEVFHFYRDLGSTHGVPFLFRIYPGELWADTWERLQRKLGLSEMERKSIGIVYGTAGTLDLKRCRVIQGSLGSDSPTSTAMAGVNNNGSLDNVQPAATPPRVIDADAVASQTGRNIDQAAAALASEGLCLWDLVVQMSSEEPAPDTKVRAAGTLTGFIALNHVDRTSRRAQHQERAIKIN
ncbi:ubiquitin-specific protease ubp15 [Coemansia erecta]|nr:ubiquitin-specific protease ubp15 [Coemansia erecta]KAJ2882728.1 ubiquitin-specific protease ubp15 [Coemansia asiatica]